MSAKHRKSAKRAATRAGIAAGALAATASLAVATPSVANAAAPDYATDIGNLSQALDNFLNANDTTQSVIQAPWNSVAMQSGGLLPVFNTDFSKIDATDITNIGDLLINLGNLSLPTGVPGVVPTITIPGSTNTIDVGNLLPDRIPGGSLLVGAGNTINTLLGLDIPLTDDSVGDALGTAIPPLSQIIQGLIATQTDYATGYNWGLLGMNGQTNVLNTFVQTPSGLILNLRNIPALNQGTISINDLLDAAAAEGFTKFDPDAFQLLPENSLPSGTIWIPQGDGTYNFPLGASVGWWAAMPTADLKFPDTYPDPLGGTQTVIAAPITAAGVEGPLGLFQAGNIGANVLLPTENGVYSPLGLSLWNIGGPLGFSVTNLNITTDNYVGTNGFNLNNGQNLMVIQNPILPIPLIYSLGGVNFGPSGAGITLPSLFGMSLTPTLQLGTAPGPNTDSGLIPTQLISELNPNLSDISGIIPGVTLPTTLTGLLGLDPMIQDGMSAISPLYTIPAGFFLQPISDFATDQYGPFVDGTTGGLLSLSQQYLNVANQLPGAEPNDDPTTDNANTDNANTTSSPTVSPQLLTTTNNTPQTFALNTPKSDDSSDETVVQNDTEQSEAVTGKHADNGLRETWQDMSQRLSDTFDGNKTEPTDTGKSHDQASDTRNSTEESSGIESGTGGDTTSQENTEPVTPESGPDTTSPTDADTTTDNSTDADVTS